MERMYYAEYCPWDAWNTWQIGIGPKRRDNMTDTMHLLFIFIAIFMLAGR